MCATIRGLIATKNIVVLAQVFLWRVPLFVLKALSTVKIEGKVGLATLWLTYECRNCGQRLPQKVPAHELATSLSDGKPAERPCGVCALFGCR